ncbi:MAG TPA: alpha/beta fold hydrolase [Geminicoccus sp.]|uniref:alpha/beta fold hydrolase n=1 Tax=Geminicoccus sp. TaxID=2024832 RepID=UPI002B565FD6|nr:alpha/beta fold hydrolase [Geminicoccus sp.]HWL67448.1 alpha/beta fold hydrolase [Geminicoccus sp.]
MAQEQQGLERAGGEVPIVWLHGAGMDRTVWMLAARDPDLPPVPSLALDLPGHGRSAAPGCDSIEDYAAFVAGVLDEMGIARACLVGHSMGALVALELALRQPARCVGLVLAGAAARMPVNPVLIEAALHDLPKAARMIATFAVAPTGRLAAPATPGIRLAGGGMALLAASRPGVLARDLRACDAARPEPVPLAMPALVVTGARDRMTPAARGAELAAALGAGLARIEGAGHMMMLEQPAAFAAAVVPFLKGLQSSSRAR